MLLSQPTKQPHFLGPHCAQAPVSSRLFKTAVFNITSKRLPVSKGTEQIKHRMQTLPCALGRAQGLRKIQLPGELSGSHTDCSGRGLPSSFRADTLAWVAPLHLVAAAFPLSGVGYIILAAPKSPWGACTTH